MAAKPYGTFKGLPKAPKNIPSNPPNTYIDEWQGWPEFLGIEDYAFLDFESARKIVRDKKFKSISDYRNFARDYKEKRLPVNPKNTYKNDGWVDWEDFLGIAVRSGPRKKMMEFSSARKFARKLNLKTSKQWVLYAQEKLEGSHKKPDNIPSQVHTYYKGKGWISYPDFLGIVPKKKNKN